MKPAGRFFGGFAVRSDMLHGLRGHTPDPAFASKPASTWQATNLLACPSTCQHLSLAQPPIAWEGTQLLYRSTAPTAPSLHMLRLQGHPDLCACAAAHHWPRPVCALPQLPAAGGGANPAGACSMHLQLLVMRAWLPHESLWEGGMGQAVTRPGLCTRAAAIPASSTMQVN